MNSSFKINTVSSASLLSLLFLMCFNLVLPSAEVPAQISRSDSPASGGTGESPDEPKEFDALVVDIPEELFPSVFLSTQYIKPYTEDASKVWVTRIRGLDCISDTARVILDTPQSAEAMAVPGYMDMYVSSTLASGSLSERIGVFAKGFITFVGHMCSLGALPENDGGYALEYVLINLGLPTGGEERESMHPVARKALPSFFIHVLLEMQGRFKSHGLSDLVSFWASLGELNIRALFPAVAVEYESHPAKVRRLISHYYLNRLRDSIALQKTSARAGCVVPDSYVPNVIF